MSDLPTTSLDDAAANETEDDSSECPICYQILAGKIGQPDKCEHLFCLDCIQQWAKSVSTCPIDRADFRNILVKTADDLKSVLRKIRVRKRTELVLPEEENEEDLMLIELGLEDDFPEDQAACNVCGSADREDEMLLCDGCDEGYHMGCLLPPLSRVPRGEWFCPVCAPDFEGSGDEDEEEFSLDEAMAQIIVPDEPSTSRGPVTRQRTGRARRPAAARTRATERVRAVVTRLRRAQGREVRPTSRPTGRTATRRSRRRKTRSKRGSATRSRNSQPDEASPASNAQVKRVNRRSGLPKLDTGAGPSELRLFGPAIDVPLFSEDVHDQEKRLPDSPLKSDTTASQSSGSGSLLDDILTGQSQLKLHSSRVEILRDGKLRPKRKDNGNKDRTRDKEISKGDANKEAMFGKGWGGIVAAYGSDEEEDCQPQLPPPVPLSDLFTGGLDGSRGDRGQQGFGWRDAGSAVPGPGFGGPSPFGGPMRMRGPRAPPFHENNGPMSFGGGPTPGAPPRSGRKPLLADPTGSDEEEPSSTAGPYTHRGSGVGGHPPMQPPPMQPPPMFAPVAGAEQPDFEEPERDDDQGFRITEQFVHQSGFLQDPNQEQSNMFPPPFLSRSAMNQQQHPGILSPPPLVPPPCAPNLDESQGFTISDADSIDIALPPGPVPSVANPFDTSSSRGYEQRSAVDHLESTDGEEYDPFAPADSSPIRPALVVDGDMDIDDAEDQEPDSAGLQLDIPLPSEMPSSEPEQEPEASKKREVDPKSGGSGAKPMFTFAWKRKEEPAPVSEVSKSGPVKLKRQVLPITRNVLGDTEPDTGVRSGSDSRRSQPLSGRKEFQSLGGGWSQVSQPEEDQTETVDNSTTTIGTKAEQVAADSTDELDTAAEDSLVIDEANNAAGDGLHENLSPIIPPQNPPEEESSWREEDVGETRVIDEIGPDDSSQGEVDPEMLAKLNETEPTSGKEVNKSPSIRRGSEEEKENARKRSKSKSPRRWSRRSRSRDAKRTSRSRQGHREASRNKGQRSRSRERHQKRADDSGSRRKSHASRSRSKEKDRSDLVMERAMREAAREHSKERQRSDRKKRFSRTSRSRSPPNRKQPRARKSRSRSPKMGLPLFSQGRKVKSWVRQRDVTPPEQYQVTVANEELVGGFQVKPKPLLAKRNSWSEESGDEAENDVRDAPSRSSGKSKKKKKEKKRKKDKDKKKHKKKKHKRTQDSDSGDESEKRETSQQRAPVVQVNFDEAKGDFSQPIFMKRKRKGISEVDKSHESEGFGDQISEDFGDHSRDRKWKKKKPGREPSPAPESEGFDDEPPEPKLKHRKSSAFNDLFTAGKEWLRNRSPPPEPIRAPGRKSDEVAREELESHSRFMGSRGDERRDSQLDRRRSRREEKQPSREHRAEKQPVREYRTEQEPIREYRAAEKQPTREYRAEKQPFREYRAEKQPPIREHEFNDFDQPLRATMGQEELRAQRAEPADRRSGYRGRESDANRSRDPIDQPDRSERRESRHMRSRDRNDDLIEHEISEPMPAGGHTKRVGREMPEREREHERNRPDRHDRNRRRDRSDRDRNQEPSSPVAFERQKSNRTSDERRHESKTNRAQSPSPVPEREKAKDRSKAPRTPPSPVADEKSESMEYSQSPERSPPHKPNQTFGFDDVTESKKERRQNTSLDEVMTTEDHPPPHVEVEAAESESKSAKSPDLMNIEEAELWLDALPIKGSEEPHVHTSDLLSPTGAQDSPQKPKTTDIVDVDKALPPALLQTVKTEAVDPKFEQKKKERLQKALQHEVGEVSSTTTEHRLKVEAKVQFQLEVEAFIKSILKPYFARKEITKDEYKTIMKRTVPEICKKSRSQRLNKAKVQRFVEQHLQKVTEVKTGGDEAAVNEEERLKKVQAWQEELGLTVDENIV